MLIIDDYRHLSFINTKLIGDSLIEIPRGWGYTTVCSGRKSIDVTNIVTRNNLFLGSKPEN